MQNTDGLDSRIYRNFEREGILFCKSNKTSCAEGWEQIRTRLHGENGRPLIYFTEDCKNCIRIIPKLMRHPTLLDDLDKNQEDHCLVAGTMVTMADGSEKAIEDVQIGEFVRNATGTGKVLNSWMTSETASVVDVIFSTGSIRGTQSHPVFTIEDDYVPIGKLEFGHTLSGAGLPTFIRREPVRGTHKVYNLTVDSHPSYYANGVLVHNCADVTRYIVMNHPIQTNFKSIKSIKRKDEAQTRLR